MGVNNNKGFTGQKKKKKKKKKIKFVIFCTHSEHQVYYSRTNQLASFI